MPCPLRVARRDSRSRRRHTDPARQLPADRYLAVTTLQDDGAKGDAADHFDVSSLLEPEARQLAAGDRIVDRLDPSPAANRYAVDPQSESPGLEDIENESQRQSECTFRTRQGRGGR